jgi:hypothetical protein
LIIGIRDTRISNRKFGGGGRVEPSVRIARLIPSRAIAPSSPMSAVVRGDLTAEVAEDRATALAIHGIAAIADRNDEPACRLGATLVVVLQGGILEEVGLLFLADVVDFHAVIVNFPVLRNITWSSAQSACPALAFATRRNASLQASAAHEIVAVSGRGNWSVVSGRALQLVRAVDASWYRSVVLLGLVLTLSLLSAREEVLEVVVLHLLVAPLRRVVVLMGQCRSKAWHDVVMDALRAHHGSVDDAYLNRWLRLLLQTETAVELDVRHVGRRCFVASRLLVWLDSTVVC